MKRNAKDKRLVLTQKPNAPIVTWAIASLFARIADGNVKEFLDLIAFGALFTWAWLELFQGANKFRRALGLAVISISLYGRLK